MMQVALELGKDIEEIASWDPDKFALWVSFLRLTHERSKGKKVGK